MHGVLTGADSRMELLLSWWYDNYRKFCDYPVAIIDFGLSPKGVAIADAIGTRIPFQQLSIKPCTQSLDDYTRANRDLWMQIPRAWSKTPFQHTLWLDVDCKVVGDIEPLFTTRSFAMAREQRRELTDAGAPLYNGGVVAYERDTAILPILIQEIEADAADYYATDHIIADVAVKYDLNIETLAPVYNSYFKIGDPNAKIIHYVGASGNLQILSEMLLLVS